MKYVLKTKYWTSLSVMALLSTSCATYAGHKRSDAFVDYARVTSVTPVYENVIKSVPVEQCWNERVYQRHSGYDRHNYQRASATPALLGAIIGGALGNELGHRKRNKQIGVAVGGLLGASIGSDIGRQQSRDRGDRYSHRDHDTSQSYQLVERCGVQHEQYEESVITGYEVAYRYRGNEYTTITDKHPGDKLQVRVKVTPVSF